MRGIIIDGMFIYIMTTRDSVIGEASILLIYPPGLGEESASYQR